MSSGEGYLSQPAFRELLLFPLKELLLRNLHAMKPVAKSTESAGKQDMTREVCN